MPKAAIDAIDRKILGFLIRNARMPFLEIARECGISGAAIHQRVKKLDEMGVILGSRLEVDPKSLGYDVCAIVGIRLSDPSLNSRTVETIKEIREVVECHYITGEYNILIKLYCLDNEHLMHTMFDRLLKIPGITATETFISLNQPFSRQIDVSGIETE